MTDSPSVLDRTRNPEWFIGGPWHGLDRIQKMPNYKHAMILVPAPMGVGILEGPVDTAATSREYRYEIQRFPIGRMALTLWISDDLDQMDAATRLAQLLLAPHKVPEQ